MKKILSKILLILLSEEFIIVILSVLLLLFSYGPLARQYLIAPPEGKVFLGSYGFPPDFWGNIISYEDGRLGHWLLNYKITTTIDIPTVFYKEEYVALGQLSRLFPVDPIIFFHICRLVLSMFLLLVIYKLISLVFKNKVERIIAYTLALFSGGIGSGAITLLYLWSPLGVFQRSAYYPHYLFAFIFILLALIFLIKALSEKKISKLLLACLFGFLTSFVHAPNTISLYFTFPFYLGLLTVNNIKKKTSPWQLLYKPIYLIVFTVISVLPMFYYLKITSGYPWNIMSKFDLIYNVFSNASLSTFILGMGPTLFLGIIGAIIILKRKDDLSYLLAPWAIIYILGYNFLWKLIHFNSQRFLQTPYYVVTAILSTIAVVKFADWVSKKIHFRKEIISLLILIILILSGLPALQLSLDTNIDNFSDVYPYYSNKENVEAIRWLGQNTKEQDIVLAQFVNGELISALSGNLTFYNLHSTLLLKGFDELDGTVREFYIGDWKNEKAKKFLKDQNIKYVFWAEEEQNISGRLELKYPFLIKVYENPKVIIFKTDEN